MVKDLRLGGSFLTPTNLLYGFAAPSLDVLRIVRCHPAQAAQFKLALADLYRVPQVAVFLEYGWQMSPEMPLDKVECWLFDGQKAVHVATIHEVGVPHPWQEKAAHAS